MWPLTQTSHPSHPSPGCAGQLLNVGLIPTWGAAAAAAKSILWINKKWKMNDACPKWETGSCLPKYIFASIAFIRENNRHWLLQFHHLSRQICVRNYSNRGMLERDMNRTGKALKCFPRLIIVYLSKNITGNETWWSTPKSDTEPNQSLNKSSFSLSGSAANHISMLGFIKSTPLKIIDCTWSHCCFSSTSSCWLALSSLLHQISFHPYLFSLQMLK